MELPASDLEMACRLVAMTELGSWWRGTTQCSRSLRCAHATRVLPQSEVETFGCSSANPSESFGRAQAGKCSAVTSKGEQALAARKDHFPFSFDICHRPF